MKVVRTAPPTRSREGGAYREDGDTKQGIYGTGCSWSGCLIWESRVAYWQLVGLKSHFLNTKTLPWAWVLVCLCRLRRYQSHLSVMTSLFICFNSTESQVILTLIPWCRHLSPTFCRWQNGGKITWAIWRKHESNFSASMLLSPFYTTFDTCSRNVQPSFFLKRAQLGWFQETDLREAEFLIWGHWISHRLLSFLFIF